MVQAMLSMYQMSQQLRSAAMSAGQPVETGMDGRLHECAGLLMPLAWSWRQARTHNRACARRVRSRIRGHPHMFLPSALLPKIAADSPTKQAGHNQMTRGVSKSWQLQPLAFSGSQNFLAKAGLCLNLLS